jgi:pimeloyl-ACP methyl ester carboxylesterase
VVDQEPREVRAPDGRRIVFHLAGPEGGELLFFHTGTPGTPYIYVGMIRECAARGLQIVCMARPGYGGSDRLAGRNYADGSADTAAVAEGLGAERFYVMGHSGGGGPALADGALLGAQVRAVAVSATLAPRLQMGSGWRDGLDLANGEELEAMEEGEAALRELLEGRAESMRGIESAEQITTNKDFGRFYSQVDRDCFVGDFLDFAVKVYPRSVSHGVDGWIDDDFGFFGDWGFDLGEVAVPTTIWQGGQDNVIPVAHAEWLAEHVPGARLELRPEDGHVSLLSRHFGAMLDDLIARGS